MSRLFTPMTSRDPSEAHRVSTPLELFFDLVFVVAVAFAASGLHRDIVENRIRHGLVSYLLVFFAIWWAWVNFTWFASAFDSDDLPYKLLVLLQMTGALILAAGVPEAFAERDFTIVVIGYVVMRLALGTQWLRAGWQDPDHRSSAWRFAVGIGVLQIGWVLWGIYPGSDTLAIFFPLVALELLVPVWAERAGGTHWHPEHILERYGLFTIIVLGESVLAASLAIQTIENLKDLSGELVGIIAGGVLILFSMWWIYFGFRDPAGPETRQRALIWSYGHYVIWAATAAVGVGISAAVDYETDHSAISAHLTGYALAVPVAIYLTGMWVFHDLWHPQPWLDRWATPVAAGLVLLTPFTSHSTLSMGLILVALCALRTANPHTSDERMAV